MNEETALQESVKVLTLYENAGATTSIAVVGSAMVGTVCIWRASFPYDLLTTAHSSPLRTAHHCSPLLSPLTTSHCPTVAQPLLTTHQCPLHTTHHCAPPLTIARHSPLGHTKHSVR